jgi:chaperonin cofactor prefoldin
MDDSRKKSFLSELLGLDKVEKIVEQSKLEIVELEKLLLINEELLRNTPELPVPNLEMPVDNTAELEGDLKTTQWAQVQVKIKQTALEKEIEELKRKINKAQGVLTWFLKDLETDRTNSVELQAALKKLKDLDDPSKVQVLDQSMKLAYKELVSFKESLRGTDNERSIKFLQESLKDMEKEISRIPQLLNELDKVNQNLNSLHDEKCFVCDGPRVRNPEVVRQVEAQKAALEGRVEALESSRAHFPVRSGQLEAQIQAYRDADKANQNQGARLEELCNKYRRDLTDYEASIAKNKQMVALEIKNIESQIALARNEASGVYKTQVDSLKGKLHTLELNRMDLVNKYREHTSKISSIENDIKLNKLIETQARTEYNIRLREYQKNQNHRNQWIDNINKFRTRANLEKDLCDALGREGFLGSIFEEVLMDISQRTNEYLKQIPNVATLTISLDTEKETKSGKISRKITPVVYKSGKAVPLTGGISGGMLAVVALAVDLALLSIIQERTGFELGWLILDEAMDGLGSIEKEACFELLRQVAHNKLILVIDHDDKAKAFCDGSIRVTTENDRSEISPTIT